MRDDQDSAPERERSPDGAGRTGVRRNGRYPERDVTARIETVREPQPSDLAVKTSVEASFDTSFEGVLTTSDETLESEAVTAHAVSMHATSRVVDSLFIAIYGVLAVRLLAALFAVRETAGVGRIVTRFTDPLYSPFRGTVGGTVDDQGNMLALPVLIALLSYALLHGLIMTVLRTAGQTARGTAPHATLHDGGASLSETDNR